VGSELDSTVVGIGEGTEGAVWVRRVATSLVLAVVVAAFFGVLGERSGEVSSEQDGWRLSLRYPEVARAGLDTPWQVTVEHAGGFDKELTIAVTGSYFDLFETQGFHPEPSDSTRDGDTLYLTFTAPEADTFVVAYDAYIQPSSQRGATARVDVVDGTTPIVGVNYRTRLVP